MNCRSYEPRITKYKTKCRRPCPHDVFVIKDCQLHSQNSSSDTDSTCDEKTICNDNRNVDYEIKNLECKLSEQINCHQICNEHHHKTNRRISKIRISIDNLSVNKCFDANIEDGYAIIFGTTQSNCIKVHDLSGLIKIDDIVISDIDNVFGNIMIYNTDNGIIYNGIMYVDGDCLKYVLSNKPLIPVEMPFSGIVSLVIHLSR